MRRRATTTVLFDLDDTLFDHTHSSLAGLAALRERFGELARVPIERLAAMHGSILEAFHSRVLVGEMTIEQARTARFGALCAGCDAPHLDADELASAYRNAYQSARRPVPGALALLGALKGRVRIGVVTNNMLAEQIDKLHHLRMTDLVDVLVVSEEVGAKKPEPAIFGAALERCRAVAEETVMLGDSWATDVLGARCAGIWPVWLNRTGQTCPERSCCDEIRSLEPLSAALGCLGIPIAEIQARAR